MPNIAAIGLCKVNGFVCSQLTSMNNMFNYLNIYGFATGIRKIFINVFANDPYGDVFDIKTDYFVDSGARPTNPDTGRGYWDQSLQKVIYWNGTAWVDATGTTV